VSDNLRLRTATAEDLPAVVEIHNAGIAERVTTFKTQPRAVADISS